MSIGAKLFLELTLSEHIADFSSLRLKWKGTKFHLGLVSCPTIYNLSHPLSIMYTLPIGVVLLILSQELRLQSLQF